MLCCCEQEVSQSSACKEMPNKDCVFTFLLLLKLKKCELHFKTEIVSFLKNAAILNNTNQHL